jgi:hypothetical protein
MVFFSTSASVLSDLLASASRTINARLRPPDKATLLACLRLCRKHASKIIPYHAAAGDET